MKTIIITLLLVVASTARAQTVPWVSYKPLQTTTSSSSSSYSVPSFSIIDDEMYELRRRDLQREYQNQVVESDVINSGAISTATGNGYPIQVKTELRRNGNFSMKCIGIKMNNKWVSCECDITDMQDVYKQAKTQEDKSAILELMEIANYVFQYGSTIYLIPKAE